MARVKTYNFTNCYNVGQLAGSGAGAIMGNGNYTIDNCYWLNTYPMYGANSSATIPSTCESLSSIDTLKGYASKLGNAYVADTANMNNGLPILAWQMDANGWKSYILEKIK